MLLMLRVATGPSSATRGPVVAHDLVVELDAEHRVGDLMGAIAVQTGAVVPALLHERSGRVLDPAESVEAAGVLSGDVVRITTPEIAGAGAVREPAVAVTVAVTSGPDGGRSRLLGPGTYLIGRHTGCDVVVDDPTVSRRHLVVDVADDWTVSVGAHPDASQVVRVNGEALDGPVVVDGDDMIAIGSSRLAFRPFACAELRRNDRLGQVEFQRTPYRPAVVTERPAELVGPIPTRPEPRRLQLLAVLGPLAAGLAMYAFSRQVQFLALTLMSPLVMLATAVDDRRSGRRTMRHAVADFRDVLVRRRQHLIALRDAERAERWRSAPDLADLLQRAERRTIDLWARGRGAADFLTLRLGLGSTRTAYAIELDRGGDDDLRDEALAAVDGLTEIDEAPITVDLLDTPIVGLHGRERNVDAVVTSLVVQAACLHSPDDLTIVVAVDGERGFEWLKWLPHVRSVTSPVAGHHVAGDTAGADRLIGALLDVVTFRTGDATGLRRNDIAVWPRILAVVDSSLAPDPAEVARLLDLGPAAGVSVIWMANRAADVPHQATAVLALDLERDGVLPGALWGVDPEVPPVRLVAEGLAGGLADRAARALAPVRDASTASLATSIPRSVDLLSVIGADAATQRGVTERWQAASRYALDFPIGMGSAGVVELDLVEDGPHALIGGTSGAGKSELLQAMVASLASRHPANRLNFLFVDYKGGAASKVFERLPHTVGYVTNLGADLALRALTSLRAELNHRMALMEGRAKDLAEMLAVAPEEAPASLVIVVDEFATLVKEVPEFVAGIVDIAQRGRSLGIHLVLATQRPSGAVNENILANTNLRVSLRMLDRSESTAVIGGPDAADIPVPLRGRAFARLGAQTLVPFQSAYGGAPLVSESAERPVLVGAFDSPQAAPTQAVGSAWRGEASGGTQLDAVIDAIAAADVALGLPAPRRPWCDALADVVPLDTILADDRSAPAREHPGRILALGLLDAPERQEQAPYLVDLEEAGGLLVFGAGGSGKTTALRTAAASLQRCGGARAVAVIAFDFASRGLNALRSLPCVVDVATGDDLEAVTRHLLLLDRELIRRREVLARASAEHLTAYNERHAPLHRIVVMVDGIGAMLDALADGGSFLAGAADAWAERLLRLVVDGRQVGIHAVLASDRRNAIPSRIHAAISNRLILRHADDNAYAEHGIPLAVSRSLELAPGRGLVSGGAGVPMVQIAAASSDHGARGQAAALDVVGRTAGEPHTSVLASRSLPERLPLDDLRLAAELGVFEPHEVPIGCFDVSGDPAAIDVRWSHVLVAGRPRTGRSTALDTIATGLAERYEVVRLGTSASGLQASTVGTGAFGRDVPAAIERVVNLVAMGEPRRPIAVVVDDLDALDDPMLAAGWEQLLRSEHVRIVAAIETRALSGFTTNPLLVELKRSRRQLILCPDDPAEFVQNTGVKLPQRPGVAWGPGRGVLLADRLAHVVQVAMPSRVAAGV